MIGWTKLINPFIRLLRKNGYELLQTKEKFGEFRCYYGRPSGIDPDLANVIDHALDQITRQSRITCIQCGKTARMHLDGWHLPLCEEHSKAMGRDWDEAKKPVSGWITSMYELSKEDLDQIKASKTNAELYALFQGDK